MQKVKCLIIDDEPMAREIIRSYVEKISNLDLFGECKNVSEALEVLQKETIDLLFLDINMPEISGLTLAKTLSSKTKIIFTTAYREYAIEGFDLQAVDYLLKPISFDRFFQAVRQFDNLYGSKIAFSKVVENTQMEEFIFVRSERKMVKVNFNEIRYIESLSDYIKIHLNDQIIVTRETINNIESKLPKDDFLRVHRSFIVSVQQITSYTNEYIELDKKAIPISRSYKENVLKRLHEK
ncbi:LytTR family DNA-binding domain-containing protein [Pseudotenacibaculum sp. MALMAid0570]|uniref:LytR/AlgR family response regulator transcription factor n=1 Tax=Pseudotenacibaculum sp. MALMAid0570 TaxID=3143938 RepID=UPI0032DF39EF